MAPKDIDDLVLPSIKGSQSKQSEGPSSDDMIWIRELIKVYKSGKIEVTALRGVSTEIKKGEIVAIIGPSGCGKTTLLNIIGGLDDATAGKVYVNGKNIRNMKEDKLVQFRRGTVGFIFQNFNLIPSLTAKQNIELPMRLNKLPLNLRSERIAKLFKSIGLEERMDHRPEQLSGGEQQRVAFAVALANDPPLILADEPTGELDTRTGQEIMEIFKALSRQLGKTELIVTHDQRIADFADRTLKIMDGKISEEG
jgi:putative ABC transport system ATP-binding protein